MLIEIFSITKYGFQTLNTIALLLTFWVAVELNKIRRNSPTSNLGKRDFKQMSQVRQKLNLLHYLVQNITSVIIYRRTDCHLAS